MSVTLSAYEASNDRIVRLAKVVAFLGDRFFNGPYAITKLHDHKGNLDVTWDGLPSGSDVNFVGYAWQEVGNEPAKNVDHYLLYDGEEVMMAPVEYRVERIKHARLVERK